jgi:hypothetical protein
MINKISSHRRGAVAYTFDNGNIVSIVFSPASYSDNYDMPYGQGLPEMINSTTVEIMPSGNKAFIRWMEKKYDGDLICSYIPVSEIPTILKRADSKQYKPVEGLEKEERHE